VTLPSVGVIIPARNAAPTLRATLESLISQTVLPDEVILVDDGSTDDTVAIARSFDLPISIVTAGGHGSAAARNAGLAMCTSELVGFLDADDLWMPTKLESHARALRDDPASCGAYSLVSWVDGEGRVLRSQRVRRSNRSTLERLA